MRRRSWVQDSLHSWRGLPLVERVVAGCKFQNERKIQNESIWEKNGLAASRRSHRVAHPGVCNSQSACLRGGGRTGVAVGATANKVATVVERSRSRGNRDY